MPSDCACPQRTKNATHPSLYRSCQYQIVLLIHERALPQMTELWSEVFEASFHSNVSSDPFDSWAIVIERMQGTKKEAEASFEWFDSL